MPNDPNDPNDPNQKTVPDFGMVRSEYDGVVLECPATAPGLTLHDLVCMFEEASATGNPLAGNPSEWPVTRGVQAVRDAIMKAIYVKP